ncbi:MAG: hypothetical protein HZB87_13715, partial [Desulfatitalea sp.]|nr:hypothetical protein [Desulfatitalea sp.]
MKRSVGQSLGLDREKANEEPSDAGVGGHGMQQHTVAPVRGIDHDAAFFPQRPGNITILDQELELIVQLILKFTGKTASAFELGRLLVHQVHGADVERDDVIDTFDRQLDKITGFDGMI